MSDFVLKSEYTPTGDQPEAIASLTAGIASGRKMQTQDLYHGKRHSTLRQADAYT